MPQPSETMSLADLRELLKTNPNLVLKVRGDWLLALSEAHSWLLDEQRVPTRTEHPDGASE